MSFRASAQEQQIIDAVLAKTDPSGFGIVTGEEAVKAFAGSDLSPTTLGEIWTIADTDNSGFLTEDRLGVALRLIGWAQAGYPLTEHLATLPGQLPVLEGISVLEASPSGPTLPQLTPNDRQKFLRMFTQSGPINGLLSGDEARDIFLKSKLSNNKLLQIWNLADTRSRGSLDATDFVIGMFLIQSVRSNALQVIPKSLPSGLYEQASGGITRSSLESQDTGQSQSSAAVSRPYLPGHSTTTSQTSIPHKWDIPPEKRAKCESFFAELDAQNRGFIDPDVATAFMCQSQLSERFLAQIWDLVDLNNDGNLTRDEFTVAIYLIDQKLAGHELPTKLPASLVPPSLRTDAQTASLETPVDIWSFGSNDPTQTPMWSPNEAAFAPASANVFGNLFNNEDRIPLTAARTGSFDWSTPNAADVQNRISDTQASLSSTAAIRSTIGGLNEIITGDVTQLQKQLAQLKEQLSQMKTARESEEAQLAELLTRKAQETADLAKAQQELLLAKVGVNAAQREREKVERELRDVRAKAQAVVGETEELKTEAEQVKRRTTRLSRLLLASRTQLATGEEERGQVLVDLDKARKELEAEQTGLGNSEMGQATRRAYKFSDDTASSAPVASLTPNASLSSISQLNVLLPGSESAGQPPLAPESRGFETLNQGNIYTNSAETREDNGIQTQNSGSGSLAFATGELNHGTGDTITPTASPSTGSKLLDKMSKLRSTNPFGRTANRASTQPVVPSFEDTFQT